MGVESIRVKTKFILTFMFKCVTLNFRNEQFDSVLAKIAE